MQKQLAVPMPDGSGWFAESLRLTVFHQLSPQQDDNGWWEEVAGAQPESKNLKPREGGYEVSGPCFGGVLTLKALPGRFDWYLATPNSMESPPGLPPGVGMLPDALAIFVPAMKKWLAKEVPITRVAFGAVFMQSVADRIAGYKLLDAYLPSVEIDWEHSSEFLYQINRHHNSKMLDELHINRISKWTVALFQPMVLSIGAVQVPSASALTGDPIHALRLEVDINTDVARQSVMPGEKMPELFEYLVTLGREIAIRGDIK